MKDITFRKKIKVLSPINIAIVKYWGKSDEELILPANNSISLTLDPLKLHSASIVEISTDLVESEVLLNNGIHKPSKRMTNVFKYAIRNSSLDETIKEKLKFLVKSNNNFPTAAGLASSASGMSAFAFGLGKLLELDMKTISVLARMGSGSASRSVFGGIVEWNTSIHPETSYSIQLYDENYWSDLMVYVCIVNSNVKKTTSTAGMQTSMATSTLLPHRVNCHLPLLIGRLKKSLEAKDFSTFAQITMAESNQLHAICMDTYPPIRYLTDQSHQIIDFVHEINKCLGTPILAYTFDAGPNAFLIFEKKWTWLIQHLLKHCFMVVFDKQDDIRMNKTDIHEKFEKEVKENLQHLHETLPRNEEVIQKVICTKIGSGPVDCTDRMEEYAQYFESINSS